MPESLWKLAKALRLCVLLALFPLGVGIALLVAQKEIRFEYWPTAEGGYRWSFKTLPEQPVAPPSLPQPSPSPAAPKLPAPSPPHK